MSSFVSSSVTNLPLELRPRGARRIGRPARPAAAARARAAARPRSRPRRTRAPCARCRSRPPRVTNVARDHDPRALVGGERHDLERPRVGESHAVGAAGTARAGARRRAAPSRPAAAVLEHDRAGARLRAARMRPSRHSYSPYSSSGVHRERHVRRQRPRRRRPDDEARAGFRPRAGTSRRSSGRGRRRSPARARGSRARCRSAGSTAARGARTEQALLVQPLQQPPHRLDVVVAVGDVRVDVVEPVADPVGELLPLVLVLEDALLRAAR